MAGYSKLPGPAYTSICPRLGSTETVGPLGVPVTVGMEPVGCWACTGIRDRLPAVQATATPTKNTS